MSLNYFDDTNCFHFGTSELKYCMWYDLAFGQSLYVYVHLHEVLLGINKVVMGLMCGSDACVCV